MKQSKKKHSQYNKLQKYFSSFLFRQVRAGNEKNESKSLKLEKALPYKYIDPNNNGYIRVLTIDIDWDIPMEEYIDRIPPPNVIVTNPENGHKQIMYFLKSRIYIENRKIMYAYRMIRNNLNMILKGDFGFAGRLQKNPLHHSWNTAWFNNDPYSLSVLIDWSMKQEFGADSDKCHVHDLTSRNETIFKSLLKFACRNKKELTYEYLESHAGYLNSLCPSFDTIIKTPLGNAEVRGIARSVWKFMQTRYTGSNKNGEGQYTDEQRKHSIENRTAKKWRNIHLFIEYQKMKIDLKTIASILHVTKKTIKNYIIILHTNLSVTNKTNSIASSHSADVPQNTENTNTANTTGVAKQREPPAPTKPPPIQRITDTVFQGIVAGRLLARTAAAGFAINTS